MIAILIALICPTWFTLWIGIELSLLAFIPIFSYGGSIVSEGITLYFLNQVRGSILFVLFNILAQSATGILRIGIALKLGLFPFLYWVPAVIRSLSWIGCLVIRTLQKVLPFFALMILCSQFSLIAFCSLIRIYYSGTLGVRAVSLRALIAYSRVGNIGWALICLTVRPSLFLYFLVIYFFILIYLFTQFNNLSKLNSIFKKSRSFWIIFFVLSGIPPFGVFGIKVVLFMILLKSSFSLSLLMALGAMLPLLYYISVLLLNIRKLRLKELNLSLVTSIRLIHLFLYVIYRANWIEFLVT